jgi:hypothetical protein
MAYLMSLYGVPSAMTGWQRLAWRVTAHCAAWPPRRAMSAPPLREMQSTVVPELSRDPDGKLLW